MQHKLVFLIILSIYSHEVISKLLDSSYALHSRKKRFLIYQEGINWVQMVGGIGIPSEVKEQSITIGAVVKSYYLLPTNSSTYTNPSLIYERKKRSTTRWELYTVAEKFIESLGFKNGKSCILHAICEAAMVPFDEGSGLLSEIMHLVLTPSATNEDISVNADNEYFAAEMLGKEGTDCKVLFPDCDALFMDQFSQILSHH